MLLLTKLHVPDLPPNLVPRLRLDALLAGWRSARLILMTAPAGYGKTTLTGSWARREFAPQQPVMAVAAPAGLDHAPHPWLEPTDPGDHAAAQRLCWISLDESDNDPHQFVSYLAAALEPIAPAAASAAQRMLAGAHITADKAVTALINAVGNAPCAVLLVLDDYHLITEPAVHGLLQMLLERGPANLHCLLTTRRTPPLPINRYRVRRQILELRSEDLKFTTAETQQFFIGSLPDYLCTEQTLAALTEQTDGWGAGMQLAALALREGSSRGQPALPAGHDLLAEYVVAEVLDFQPAAVRQFMLETSILTELSSPLCQAVTLQADCTERLHFLAQATALVTAVDSQQGVYRYHSVLRTVLERQLEVRRGRSAVMDLHRRAAAWYAAQGSMDKALRHWRAAGDDDAAADLLEQNCLPMLLRGDVQTVARWLAQLPAEVFLHRPRLALDTTWLSLITERSDVQEKLTYARLAVAGADPTAAASALWRQELLGLEAGVAYLHTDLARASELSLRGLAAISPQQSLALGTCHSIQMVLHRYTGPVDVITQHAEAADAAYARAGFIVGRMSVLRTWGLCLFESGQSGEAARTFRRLIEFSQAAGVSQISEAAETHFSFGMMLYYCNQLDEARAQFEAGLTISRLVNDSAWTLWALLWLSCCDAVQQTGQPPDSAALAEEERLWHEVRGQRSPVYEYEIARVRALRWLAFGDGAQAWQAITSTLFNPNGVPANWQMRYFATYVAAYLARGKSAAALVPTFNRWETHLRAGGWSVPVAIQLRVAAARLSAAQGNHAAAVKRLDEALPLVAASGYLRLVLDHLEALRPLLPRCRAPLARQLLEEIEAAGNRRAAPPLSDVELNILRLIGQDRTRQEIAAALIVSENTIKFHLKRIYAKLGVPSRRAAVAKARELGIL